MKKILVDGEKILSCGYDIDDGITINSWPHVNGEPLPKSDCFWSVPEVLPKTDLILASELIEVLQPKLEFKGWQSVSRKIRTFQQYIDTYETFRQDTSLTTPSEVWTAYDNAVTWLGV